MEDVAFILFVTLVGAVFAFCLRTIWFAFRTKPKKYRLRNYEIAILNCGLLGLVCVSYGFSEPYALSISRVSFQSKKVARDASPIRIVHISDMHCDGVDRLENRLPPEISKLKPDLIVFTGDSANNKNGLVTFRQCITQIAKISPTFAVYGNHDSRGGKRWDIYGGTGVHWLDGASETVEVRGFKIFVAGAGVDKEAGINSALANVPADALSIFLYHYPVGADVAQAKKVDLFCAGHTHGGQIRLPGYGALVTNSVKGKKLESGLYALGTTHVYVSRGIGMIGIPIRFLCPPEIALIEVPSEQ